MMRGTKPKPEGQRRRRNAPTIEWTEVLDAPFEDGPKLPRTRHDGKTWPKRTKEWWAVISRMPHCVLWTEADWQYAIDTAYLAAEYHEGRFSVAPAYLAREKRLGTTLDFRRDLRIRYVDAVPEAEEQAGVTSIVDYRAVAGG